MDSQTGGLDLSKLKKTLITIHLQSIQKYGKMEDRRKDQVPESLTRRSNRKIIREGE